MSNESQVSEAPVNFGANLGYVLDLYDIYLNDPGAVPEDLQVLFSTIKNGEANIATNNESQSNITKGDSTIKRVMRLIDNIRQYGHLLADIYPVNRPERENVPKLTIEDFNLDKETLESISAGIVSDHFKDIYDNAYEAIVRMEKRYKGPIAFEYTHINNNRERVWLKRRIETPYKATLNDNQKVELFKNLAHVEGFEKYLHKNFVGAKRFSIEGVDTLVPMLQQTLRIASDEGIQNIQIGMAHRGRLNVLTHVLEKPYEMMISEFMHTDPMKFLPKDGSLELTSGWSGDVKYHLGGVKTTQSYGTEQKISLANNPSHLEIVSPVVLGKTRANQDTTDKPGSVTTEFKKSMPILIHGDAAYPGQGINFEAMNLGNLDGYSTGGSLHIITNNRIGFTTEPQDGRSTTYSSDVAKGYDVPIMHVNADNVEATIEAIEIAMAFRKEFHKDVVIDLVGYRRYGHNEMDEPSITNPLPYHEIRKHESVEILYGKQLVSENIISEDEMNHIIDEVQKTLRAAHDKIDKNDKMDNPEMQRPESLAEPIQNDDSELSFEQLKEINDAMLTYPSNFNVLKKLNKVLEKRKEPFESEDGLVDWAQAEQLAFATITQNGTPIRLTGQDSERGTFSHRHAVLHDPETGEQFVPLHNVPDQKATFEVRNSPLSEAAVVGFEYGYNVQNKSCMTIWEAQYGDFSNMAQMIFDNFLFSSRAKWGERSGLTLFLPHSFEGQGPEHSSARLERFLQLAGENNSTIVNLSSSSNYFHLLRAQAANLGTQSMRPLVVMSPKSLLRNKTVADPISKFTSGKFEPILPENHDKASVKKVILASGKMFIDLKEYLAKNPNDSILIVAVERLYPFPADEIDALLNELPNLENVAWVQEEPKNQGAWSFVYPYLKELTTDKYDLSYHGRIQRSAPAEGDGEIHKLVQNMIIEQSTNIN
ncbi:2-oxoglutarate dehydrogenase E1 component [Staphylococcus pseudoxylosus]|uniref:2-oxoglutarate dehydrogenase E1 component n=1 Tax=Staphylococcus pseudoxylosus TaxID=2282419 RepID=UPI000D1D3179|nr:2-oxoglutarate dehydrogenase E1 component [Staphylococcus pseudoxylosus]PTI44485.1 2-oxoglutarate dehydrogenase E1 component [Staphylococcus xylosus]MEB6035791.1 2-oxoglutarate dehydrogenase E1 component [Staphylococcus pseudoxylosus]MEB6059958.1 2-oxoglutarate dehydrogenase E1 component [Staphylococcus pseudoxylosus]MEB7763135.1 2-oxoglutarate dehydrogenase E1 component [Staphylococcus pseudoxylosus]MEB8086894.1 2-oxoglutarate dehydrogenase E1 component [Staphylococcus pseudoxylosus]